MKSTLKKKWGRVALCLCMANFACAGMAQTNKKLDAQVLNTMKTATRFMMDKVSYNGGFVWNYLPDMSRSWGEMEAKKDGVASFFKIVSSQILSNSKVDRPGRIAALAAWCANATISPALAIYFISLSDLQVIIYLHSSIAFKVSPHTSSAF